MIDGLRWASIWTLIEVLVVGLSACTQQSGRSSDNFVGGQVEIFSWWTHGSESLALEAMFDIYRSKYPNTTIINAALLDGNLAKIELTRRLSANDPPDLFQMHVGRELHSWVHYNNRDDTQSKLERLDLLYESEGWSAIFNTRLVELASVDGHIYAVPVNLQRENNLYYNTRLFADNGLVPPTTLGEFYGVADEFKRRGIKPLALGAKPGSDWVVRVLFQAVFAAVVGAEYYDKFWGGKASPSDPQLKLALEEFVKFFGYIGDDADMLDWDTAAKQVGEGKAAMTIHGDWVLGYMSSDLHLVPDVDFAESVAPGTVSMFIGSADAFGLPVGSRAAARGSAISLLKVFGSREGQDAFNPKKGSIPARVDADRTLYDAALNRRIDQAHTDAFLRGLFEVSNAATPVPVDTIVGDMRRIYVANGAEAAVQAALAAFASHYSKLSY